MMTELHTFLLEHPVGLLFLVVGIGYLVGKIRIIGFDLGPVSGVLFVGLVFGNYGYELSPTVQTMGFVLFIFSVGLQAGPRFFSVLRTDGLRYLALAVVIGGTGFALALTLARAFHFELGAAAGLLAGGMTSSPTLAAAQEAVRAGQVPLPDGMAAPEALTNVTTAYAITYIFGLVGLILIIRTLPGLLGIDLPAEAEKIGAGEAPLPVGDRVSVRAYRVERDELVGVPYREVLERLPAGSALLKHRRHGELLDVHEHSALEMGDEIAVVGKLDRFIAAPELVGPEITDESLLDMATESARIVVTRADAVVSLFVTETARPVTATMDSTVRKRIATMSADPLSCLSIWFSFPLSRSFF